MKFIEKNILPFEENIYFFPLRDKTDYAKLVVLAARNLLLENETSEGLVNCSMKLIIDKMSRLFFYSKSKYFSVSFPFNTIFDDNNQVVEIVSYSGKQLDFQSISAIISILDNEQFRLNPSPIDFYIESDPIESLGLFLLEEIFRFEPSYIRYDNDPANYKGKLHPLHHLDINYSSYGTFKLGLNDMIVGGSFENILNITTDCSFLTD